MAIAMPEGGDTFSKAHEFLGNLFVKFLGSGYIYSIYPEEMWPQFLFFPVNFAFGPPPNTSLSPIENAQLPMGGSD